jgi:hypothetical protein
MIGNINDKTEEQNDNQQVQEREESYLGARNFKSNYGNKNEYYKGNIGVKPSYNQNYLNNFQNPNINFNFQQGMGNYYFNSNDFYDQSGGHIPKYQGQFYAKKNFNNQNEEIIQSLKFVSVNYPHLISLNNSSIGLSKKVQQEQIPRFYVIKSFTEEDIHKVIKMIKNIVN